MADDAIRSQGIFSSNDTTKSSIIQIGDGSTIDFAPRTNWEVSTNEEYTHEIHHSDKAIDEDDLTFFHQADSDVSEASLRSNWLQIDFGHELLVSQIHLTFRPDEADIRRKLVEVCINGVLFGCT